MSTYAISFKLESNSTYAARYTSLMEQIRACTNVWTETTSFALVSTNETIDQLEQRLYYKTLLSASSDILVVINVTGDAATIRGTNSYPHTLSALLPSIVQK
jgi:hypothetical protein